MKSVSVEDIEELFSVTFLAISNGRQFVIASLDGNDLNVSCDDREYAEAHGFSEIEHGVWISKKPLNSFDEFQFVKFVETCNEKTVLNIEREQLTKLWLVYVQEVNL